MSALRRIAERVALVAAAGLLSFMLAACGGSKSTADNGSVELQVTAPADGSSVRADRVAVRGTVSPEDATVQIREGRYRLGTVSSPDRCTHRGANTVDVVASAAGSAPATATITVNRPRPRPARPKASRIRAKGAPPLSGATDCGNGLTVGAHTSCPFAENVRAAYQSSGSGILDVYSPTTGRTYRMYCTSGSPHVCTGGNGAVSISQVANRRQAAGHRCAGNLVVGPNTSCAFASNVQAEYYLSGPGWISVYSPVTDRTYEMYCTASSPHACTGGNNRGLFSVVGIYRHHPPIRSLGCGARRLASEAFDSEGASS